MKKLFNLILIITLMFIGIGFTFKNVDASAGDNNKSRTLINLIDNGDFSNGIISWENIVSGMSVISGRLYSDGSIEYPQPYQSVLIDEHIYYTSYDYEIINNGVGFHAGGMATVTDVYSGSGNFSKIYITTISNNGSAVYMLGETYTNAYIDNVMLFDLTVLYGAGNEPSLTEFEIILEDAPEYFDEWTYNYYEADSSIGEFACQRYADNLITTGDFSTSEDKQLISSSIINEELVFDTNTNGFIGAFFKDMGIFNIDDNVYFSFEVIENTQTFSNEFIYSGFTMLDIFYTLDISNIGFINGFNGYIREVTDSQTSGRLSIHRSLDGSESGNLIIDNVMLFNLTILFGMNNEPSLAEWEIILNENLVDGYTDGFYFDDTCYMTVEQNNPINQYYLNSESVSAELNITMTETILEMDAIDPLIYIEKYNLEMNYLGLIYEGNITSSSVNVDGYTEHTLSYLLPSPVSSEDGYIYVAYDEEGGNILSAGYVYKEVSDAFQSSYSETRTVYDAIGINNSVYLDIVGELQFDNNYNDYMFNSEDDIMITHFRINKDDVINATINYFSENTDQMIEVEVYEVYYNYCDVEFIGGIPYAVFDCYYFAGDGSLPDLYQYIYDNYAIVFSDYLKGVLDDYDYQQDLFFDDGYIDNKGVYTYYLYDGVSQVNAIGETPIYYFDDFHEMGIFSHEIRNGRNLFLEIDKYSNYLDEVYTYQFLYDNNTGVYNFDINNDENQTIIMEVFDGLTPDDATVYYHLKNVNGVYNNGASEDLYDVYMSDSYVMTSALPFSDRVDEFMDSLGMDSVLGRLIIGVLTLILITIGLWLFTKNFLIVLIVDFIVIALLAVLDIIPVWIILFVIMLFFGGLFIKNRRS